MSDPSINAQSTTISRKPSNSAFKQQRLPAWQPILTAGTVLPTFFIIGVAFIPIGIGLLYFSNNVKEFTHDYTDCESYNYPNKTCADVLHNNIDANCYCNLTVKLTESFDGDVFIYYGLNNFYQNHRRYVKSRDDHQLLGRLKDPSDECEPFAYAPDPNAKGKSKGIPIVPCGAIANSMFNDTIILSKYLGDAVPVLRTGIAWPSDRQMKFKNPTEPNKNLSDSIAALLTIAVFMFSN